VRNGHASGSRVHSRPAAPHDALAAALWPLLPGLADEVIAAIGAEVPVYARPLEGNFGTGVRRGVQDALKGFLELLERRPDTGGGPASVGGAQAGGGALATTGVGGAGVAAHRRVSYELGRGEVRQGRSLEALLAAYRVGARVTWRRCGLVASVMGLSGDELVRLGELLFAVIDALSAAAAEGYAREQYERAGEQDRRRRRLGTLLVAGTAAEATLVDAAAAAGWRPPQRLSAVVASRPELLAPLLADPSALPASEEGHAVALVADADGPGRRRQLESLLGGAAGDDGAGRAVAVGPAVPWIEVRRSVQRASTALKLLRAGRLRRPGPVWTCDELVPLVLNADPEVGADLVAAVLAPLAQLPAGTADRLAETLEVWLALHGARAAVAEQLHVHPQTVRYRLRQIQELFGDQLRDPDTRFELQVALRARRLLAAREPAPTR
jgi:hypothetical protein